MEKQQLRVYILDPETPKAVVTLEECPCLATVGGAHIQTFHDGKTGPFYRFQESFYTGIFSAEGLSAPEGFVRATIKNFPVFPAGDAKNPSFSVELF